MTELIELLRHLAMHVATDASPSKRFITVHPNGEGTKGNAVPVDDNGIPSGNGELAKKLRQSWKAPSQKTELRSVAISQLMPSFSKVVISTNLVGLKLGSTKDKHCTEQHKAQREAGNFSAAKYIAKSLSENPSTEDAGDYLLAKYHRDDAAASRVVSRILKPQSIQALTSQIDPTKPVVFVPLQNKEGEGNNRIPFAFAKHLSQIFEGSSVCLSISKVSKEHNTAAKASDRIQRKFVFEGKPDFPDNAQVIIVDDTWTSGQTCVSMASYIKSIMPTCQISGITTLAASRHGVEVHPSEERISKVLTKGGLGAEADFKNLTGIDIRTRTGSELHTYLLNGAKGSKGITDMFGTQM